MAIALASRDVIPRPKPRPGELPEMHWQAGPALPAGRSSFRAVALGRTIYAIGGSVGEASATDRVDALDVDTGRWTARAPLPTARFGHAVVALAGRIYAIGGSRRGESLGAVEVYDPAADRWRAAAPPPPPRYNLHSVAPAGRT